MVDEYLWDFKRQQLTKMIKPFLLRTPPYDPSSGGIKVMYGLYGWLLAKGQPAFLNTQIDIPSVGIYPEIYQGNDMGAQKVVRYILQTPGMMGTTDEFGRFTMGPTDFNKNDEKYVFSRVYDQWGVDDDHILFLPVIDLHTFKDKKGLRPKVAFYIGKGVNMGKHPKEAIEIKREETGDQQALAEVLNQCQTLYVYDRMSAIMEVARLCGCNVVYLGDLSLETLQKYEPGMNGLGYQKEEKLNSEEFRAHYKDLIQIFENKLDRFIDHIQQ